MPPAYQWYARPERLSEGKRDDAQVGRWSLLWSKPKMAADGWDEARAGPR